MPKTYTEGSLASRIFQVIAFNNSTKRGYYTDREGRTRNIHVSNIEFEYLVDEPMKYKIEWSEERAYLIFEFEFYAYEVDLETYEGVADGLVYNFQFKDAFDTSREEPSVNNVNNLSEQVKKLEEENAQLKNQVKQLKASAVSLKKLRSVHEKSSNTHFQRAERLEKQVKIIEEYRDFWVSKYDEVKAAFSQAQKRADEKSTELVKIRKQLDATTKSREHWAALYNTIRLELSYHYAGGCNNIKASKDELLDLVKDLERDIHRMRYTIQGEE